MGRLHSSLDASLVSESVAVLDGNAWSLESPQMSIVSSSTNSLCAKLYLLLSRRVFAEPRFLLF